MTVTRATLPEFLGRKPYSVIHIDARWDRRYREIVSGRIHSLEAQFQNDISFGYIDCDAEQDYAREIGVVNVPTVAYYKERRLVAAVVGIQQDVAENIKRMRRGDTLDTTNFLSRG